VESASEPAVRHDQRVTETDERPTGVSAALQASILECYAATGRDLPFRATRDPYAILVSEAMAQQTQASRAGEAWTRFMDAFPTATALAAATPADVLRAWQGLGYNRRALNLWRAARRIVEVHGGQVPSDLRALQALPGVGPYTARAVCALAFGMPVGAVDTNVRRVLGRIVAGDANSLRPGEIQRVADAAVPRDRPGAWTHALMDLGATVCRPRTPDCGQCCARVWCQYAVTARDGKTEPAARHPVARQRTARSASAPFPTTSRWLRGRIVDRLREAEGDAWTSIEGPIGSHDQVAVAAAMQGLVRDGIVELDGAPIGHADEPGVAWRARLPMS
jgi:A/G-specific adenine glycosylase